MKFICNIIIALSVLSPILLQGQAVTSQSAVILDTAIFLDHKTDCMPSFIMSSYGDELYCLDEKQEQKNALNITVFNVKDYSRQEILAFFDENDELLRDLSRCPIRNFWFDANNMFTVNYKWIYRFSKDEKYPNTFRFAQKIQNNYFDGSFNATQINDSVVLFFAQQDNGNLALQLYNFNTNKPLRQKELDFPLPILKIFTPRDIITTNGKEIFYSPSNQYVIKIYDMEFNEIDSIVYNKKEWNGLSEKRMREMYATSTQPADIIYSFSDEISTHSSIRRLFVFGGKVIVFYNTASTFLYDVWEKDNGRWQIENEAVNDYKKEDTSSNRLFLFSQFVFGQGKIFRCDSSVPIFRKDYTSKEKFLKAYENYQIDNDCLLRISKFSFVK